MSTVTHFSSPARTSFPSRLPRVETSIEPPDLCCRWDTRCLWLLYHLSFLYLSCASRFSNDYAIRLVSTSISRLYLHLTNANLVMANFPPPPPPPPSGGGFNNNALFTTYASANLPGLAQYAYHPSSAVGSQGSVLAGSALDAQYANARSFNTNQQGAFTGSGINDMSTSPPSAQGQLSEPVPHSPSAQYPTQLQAKHISYKNSLHESGTSQNNPQQKEASQPKDIIPDTQSAINTSAFSDLEDGELSEGNNDERAGFHGVEARSHRASLPSAGHHAHGEVNDTVITAGRPSLPVSAHNKGSPVHPQNEHPN